MPSLSFYDYAFLVTETADSPKHVAGLQIFSPPPGYEGDFVADLVSALRTAAAGTAIQYASRGLAARDTELGRRRAFRYRLSPAADPLARPGQPSAADGRGGQAPLDAAGPTAPAVGDACHRGLDDGSFALYSKIHHAYCDGATLGAADVEHPEPDTGRPYAAGQLGADGESPLSQDRDRA